MGKYDEYCKCAFELRISESEWYVRYHKPERVYSIDFTSPFKEKGDGRMMLFCNDCPKCGKILGGGTGYADYRWTGAKLFYAAVEHILDRMDISKEEAIEMAYSHLGPRQRKRMEIEVKKYDEKRRIRELLR